MTKQNKKFWAALLLLVSLFFQALPLKAQQANDSAIEQMSGDGAFKDLLKIGRGAEFAVLLEKIFGSDAETAAAEFDSGAENLFEAVTEGASRKAVEILEDQITARREKPGAKPVIAPEVKARPAKKTLKRNPPRSRKLSFNNRPKLDWRQFVFGFQPLPRQDEKPDIKMTETDKEIKAEGSDKKSFETKDAKGTRTQKAETRYIKDGKTFGVEIKNTQIIEAVSKADGKSFRRELSLVWGAEVAACPDVNGVSSGTGKAKVISKTIYTEGGAPSAAMTSEFDLQAKLKGFVNDRAEMTHYDLELDAYTTIGAGKPLFKDVKNFNLELVETRHFKSGNILLHYTT